jgi:HD-like signal output (HDOD) protein
MKRILFVDDDPEVLQGLQRMLRHKPEEWFMDFAPSGKAAWEKVVDRSFDVVVADLSMPGMDGPELLTKVMNRDPHTVRILLSEPSDRETVLRLLGLAHQYLPKPCERGLLEETLSRTLSLREMLGNDQVKRLTSQMLSLPSMPDLYLQLLEELRRDEPSIAALSGIISQDLGMCTKILQLVNSAFFGLQQPIGNLSEAILYLGVETIKGLVLSLQIFSLFTRVKIKDFSYEELWVHCWVTGMWAKRIAAAETHDPELADQAFIAGLLHDVGKLVLASGLPSQYQISVNRQREKRIPLWQAEQDVFHTAHAEVGAYLLGLWGLPDPIVEAIVWHHRPSIARDRKFSLVTAVHVASGLEHERQTGLGAVTYSLVDSDYLSDLGLLHRLDFWRESVWDQPINN